MKKQIIFYLFLFSALSSPVLSQIRINKKDFVGKNYWTKFILATNGDCKIEITPTDISPNQKYCQYDSHLGANSIIKLKALSKKGS